MCQPRLHRPQHSLLSQTTQHLCVNPDYTDLNTVFLVKQHICVSTQTTQTSTLQVALYYSSLPVQKIRDTGRNGLFTCCFTVCNTSKLKVHKTNDFGLNSPLDLIPRWYFFRANCTIPSKTNSTRKSLLSASKPWVTHTHTHTDLGPALVTMAQSRWYLWCATSPDSLHNSCQCATNITSPNSHPGFATDTWLV